MPRGELTSPVLTGVKISPWGELPSNELYIHVFTRPCLTYCSGSAFSQSFSLELLQTYCYELLKSHKWFFEILFCVKWNHYWEQISRYKEEFLFIYWHLILFIYFSDPRYTSLTLWIPLVYASTNEHLCISTVPVAVFKSCPLNKKEHIT